MNNTRVILLNSWGEKCSVVESEKPRDRTRNYVANETRTNWVMVSLARHLNTIGSGAPSADGLVNMEDEFLQPVLVSQEQEVFQKLNTLPFALAPLLLGIGLEICGIIFVSLWPEEQNKCDTYFIYLYLHCIYWLVVLLSDSILRSKHHQIRISGYLEFYQSTYQHVRAPFFVVSLWNTAYLFLAVVLHHTHKQNYEVYCRSSEWLTPINYILVLTTIELLIIIPVYVNYIKRVRTFNKLKPQPDVIREEWLNSFAQDSYASGGEVGFHQKGSNVTELLEKQADLIRYLRDHNVKLSHQMMLLASSRRSEQ